jgi:hypothetical protein
MDRNGEEAEGDAEGFTLHSGAERHEGAPPRRGGGVPDAEVRAEAQQAEADERLALKNASQKGPQSPLESVSAPVTSPLSQ